MKLKHWIVLGFAVLGVMYAYHYFVQHKGVNVGGMVGLNGSGVRAGAGIS